MSIRKGTLFVAPMTAVLAVMVGVGPASAAAGGQANCVGEFASGYNQVQIYVHGLGGRLVSDAALREGGVARYASIDNCD